MGWVGEIELVKWVLKIKVQGLCWLIDLTFMSRYTLYLLLCFHPKILCLVCIHWYPEFKTELLKNLSEVNYLIFFLPFLCYYLIILFFINSLITRNLHYHHHLNSYKHHHICLPFLPNLVLDSASVTSYNWLLALEKQALPKSVHVIY